MKKTNLFTKSLVLVALFVGFSALGQSKSLKNTRKANTENVVEKVAKSKDHKMMLKAIKTADMAQSLDDGKAHTVFAPTDEAFKKLPKKTVDKLMAPENKEMLQNVLKYHAIEGNLSVNKLKEKININGGKLRLKTMNGQYIVGFVKDDKVMLRDSKGNDVALQESKGVQSINSVLIPNMN